MPDALWLHGAERVISACMLRVDGTVAPGTGGGGGVGGRLKACEQTGVTQLNVNKVANVKCRAFVYVFVWLYVCVC